MLPGSAIAPDVGWEGVSLGCLSLRKVLLLVQLPVKLALGRILQDRKHPLLQ